MAKRKDRKRSSKEKRPEYVDLPIFTPMTHVYAHQIMMGLRCNYPDHKIWIANDGTFFMFEDCFGRKQTVCTNIIFHAFLQVCGIDPQLVALCSVWVEHHIGRPYFGWTFDRPEPLRLEL